MGLEAKKFEQRSTLRTDKMEAEHNSMAGAAITKFLGVCRRNGIVRNVRAGQTIAGANGTSWNVQIVKTLKGTTTTKNLLSTPAAFTQAGGNGIVGETQTSDDKIAAQTGVTKPILTATAADLKVVKGDMLHAVFTPTGTYSATLPVGGVDVEIAYDF